MKIASLRDYDIKTERQALNEAVMYVIACLCC